MRSAPQFGDSAAAPTADASVCAEPHAPGLHNPGTPQPPDPVSSGLNAVEAERSLRATGPNAMETADRFKLLRAAVAFSSDPLVIILLIASLISGVLGDRHTSPMRLLAESATCPMERLV